MLGCSVMSDSLWPHGLSPPGSSVCGIFQARILEWVAISSLRGSSWPGIKAASRVAPAWSGRFLKLSHLGSPSSKVIYCYILGIWRGSVREKMVIYTAGPFYPTSVPRKSSCVFSPVATIHSETSQWLMPWRRESCFVTSSFLEFNVCEWILQYEYKIAIDQAQRCISTWGFPGPCFGKNLKHN